MARLHGGVYLMHALCPHTPQLVKCLNTPYTPNAGSYMSWDRAMDNSLQEATFRVVAAWWSNHEPTAPITAVTSSSVNRLSQLYAQCKSWNGPLSAALIVPLVAQEDGTELSKANQAILLTSVLQVWYC
jgi:hypothetical protein